MPGSGSTDRTSDDSRQVEKVGVLGVPSYKGQRRNGTELGPKVLREAGLMECLNSYGCTAVDRGDVHFDVVIDDTEAFNVKNPRTVGNATKEIAKKVESIVKEDGHCLAIGGDHSMSIGTILGHARAEPDVVVLWIDAHADINTPLTSDSGNVHGMPLSFLVKELAPYMPNLPGFEGIKPCISAANVAWIGLRDIDVGERRIIDEFGMTTLSMQEVDKYGIGECVDRALKAIDPSGTRPIHLSFDVDSMDPEYVVSTGTPVSAGLSLREGCYIAETVAATGRLSMVDIAEVNPKLGDQAGLDLTLKSTMEVIGYFYGNKRQGIYPKGYTIPKPCSDSPRR